MELKSGQGGYRAYPALEAIGEQINLAYFPNSDNATLAMRNALLVLTRKKLAGDYSNLKRNLPNIDRMCLIYQKIASCNELKEELLTFIVLHNFKLDGALPATAAEYQQTYLECKGQLLETANDICKIQLEALDIFHNLQKMLKKLNSPQLLEPLSDINEQLAGLLGRHYLQNTSYEWLQHYPRFLKSIERRLEKIQQDPLSDRKRMLQYKTLWQKFKALNEEKRHSPEGQLFRWMLEEFRVSLFAQNLRTSMPVSEKRLKEQLDSL